ncbi:hypothetical protein KUTeg_019476 [Tegillarca granosa]|uniref:SGNH hydrolase-type esterase domain-containing protein n=1 Tax=Tegillarca granosa TaxID=220873 RepID=A0ABQ9ED22_TEGGR|nr:hypothetical protein KUTeg_019476 [Tegillarca granosa]
MFEFGTNNDLSHQNDTMDLSEIHMKHSDQNHFLKPDVPSSTHTAVVWVKNTGVLDQRLEKSDIKIDLDCKTDPMVHVLPFPGCQFHQLWKEIKNHVPKYKVIAIHCGVNDLGRIEADIVIDRLQQLLQNIWRVNSTAEIILSSVLPRSQNLFRGQQRSEKFLYHTNRRIDNFNMKLKGICNSNKKLHFVGHSNFDIYTMLSKDGLHLSPSGTTELVKDIMTEISHYLDKNIMLHRSVTKDNYSTVDYYVCDPSIDLKTAPTYRADISPSGIYTIKLTTHVFLIIPLNLCNDNQLQLLLVSSTSQYTPSKNLKTLHYIWAASQVNCYSITLPDSSAQYV